jgi:hypothetical protein
LALKNILTIPTGALKSLDNHEVAQVDTVVWSAHRKANNICENVLVWLVIQKTDMMDNFIPLSAARVNFFLSEPRKSKMRSMAEKNI